MNVLLSAMWQLRWYAASLFLILGTPAFLGAAQLVGDTTPKLRGQELVSVLKKGGYVIYFRHGTTSNTGEKDVEDKDLSNCQLQRNLSPEGQVQTRAIGSAFRKLQIPVGEVYSSPYCRCLDTAMNIFGKAEKSKALHFAVQLEHTQRVAITEQLLSFLGTVPQPGMNVALVSHTANLQEAVGVWPKPEGVAHIFKPEGDGQFSYVGMMLPEEWEQQSATTITRGQQPGEKGWAYAATQWFRNLF
jgi:phosphohistidine phosphatase SixA